MSVDVRTRVDGREKAVDAAQFFASVLPTSFSSFSDILSPAALWLSPKPLAVSVESETWILDCSQGTPQVAKGAPDGIETVTLSAEQVNELAIDQATPMGMFSSGKLKMKGDLATFQNWWLLIRCALDGVAPTLPGSVTFKDIDDEPLDLATNFTLSDSPEEIQHFLQEAGFLHLRGVFSEDEMNAISQDMDRASEHYFPGDGNSWWATTRDGVDRLVRMQKFDKESENVARLLLDDRLKAVACLTGDGHHFSDADSNRIEALFKPIGIVKGISDVPWHKDCSLGRHSYECCSLTIGISVTGAGPTSGQLQVLAGSHRAHIWPALLQPGLDLPELGLATETGDVTVHLSCTLHMAQPPIEKERRVLYTGLRLPPLDAEATNAARLRLREVREAASVSVSQPPSLVPAYSRT